MRLISKMNLFVERNDGVEVLKGSLPERNGQMGSDRSIAIELGRNQLSQDFDLVVNFRFDLTCKVGSLA